MYITTPKRKNGSTVVRIVESFRREGKVKNRIIKTIGQSKDVNKIRKFREAAVKLLQEYKKNSPAPVFCPIDLSRFLCSARYNKGFEDIFGAGWKQLGFESLIQKGRKKELCNHILKSLVFVRVFSPVSKLKSCYFLKERFDELISHKQVLTMMDRLSDEEESIRQRVFESILKKSTDLSVLLFDVTTLYFESVREGELQSFGYSKDGKFNETQVVLAVLADTEGLPLAYEVFPGHTGETKTLSCVLSQAVNKYKVSKVRVVADKAMFSENNFDFFQDLKEKQGLKAEYVVSCPLKKLPKKVKEQIFDFKRKQEKNKSRSESYEFFHKNRKVIVSYSEKLRAQDEEKRKRLLDKLKKLCKDNKVSASRLVKNTGIRRYLKTLKGSVEIDTSKVLKDSLWDGLYGVCSNIEYKDAKELLDMYHSLWKIEELFRINKHTLRMRPIYHRIPRRIRAHILICFLAYSVLRYTEIVLKKADCFISPQELIDTLKEVELFVIKDKRRRGGATYVIPKALTKKAQQIYSAFQKTFPDTPYPLRKLTTKTKM